MFRTLLLSAVLAAGTLTGLGGTADTASAAPAARSQVHRHRVTRNSHRTARSYRHHDRRHARGGIHRHRGFAARHATFHYRHRGRGR